MATAGVVGAPSAELDGAVADVLAALALLAEAVVLQLQHGGEGEGVVGAGDIDVLRCYARVRPQDLPSVVPGHGRDRPCLVVHVAARLARSEEHTSELQ